MKNRLGRFLFLITNVIFLSLIFIISDSSVLAAALNRPVLSEPSSVGDNASPPFSWQAVSNASEYQLQILQGKVVLMDERLDATLTGCAAGEIVCSYQTTLQLTAGKKIRWKVRAYNTEQKSKWSKALSYQLRQLAKPITVAPKQTINEQAPLYRWQAVTGATGYELELPDNSALNSMTATEAGCDANTPECQLPTSAALSNAAHRWRVRATSANGAGKWSKYRKFKVAYQPPVQPDLTGLFPTGLESKAIPFAQWQDATPTLMATPAYQAYQTDADTGHKVWRLGGSGEEMGGVLTYPDGNGALGILHGQHFYSKVSPVNSDETYVLGAGGQNQRYAALWKLATRELVAWVPAADPEVHVEQRHLMWDRKLPNVYWYAQANRLMRATIDFSTYSISKETWDTFSQYEHITLGYGEGNFSDDGERLVITGKSANDPYTYFTPYEVNQRIKHPWRQVTSPKQPEFDWAGVDPTGQYILFNRIEPNRQTIVVPFTGAAMAESRVVYEHMKHSDFVIGKNGEVWIVYGNWQGLHASRLSDGLDKRIWPAGPNVEADQYVTMSGHVARVKDIPGLVLVSRHYDGGLYYINIDQPGHSVYLGNSRHGRSFAGSDANGQSAYNGVDENGEVTFYKREPRGAVSASGRQIFFAADYQVYLSSGGYNPEPEWCRAYVNMIELAL